MANAVANQGNANQGIVNSWSLMAFARSHGRMKVMETTVKNDPARLGEKFKTCVFVDPNDSKNFCYVGFSRNLGELTPAQIAAQKADLQVVQLESDHYILCKAGAFQNAEDVDLGL